MPLCRILYTSRCTLAGERGGVLAAVRGLASASAARNAAEELTGALLHVDGTFVHLLEGPADAIEATFERICCDFRHADLKIIDLVPVKDRSFGQWNLAFFCAESHASEELREDLDEVRYLVGVNAQEAVSRMQRLLRERAAA